MKYVLQAMVLRPGGTANARAVLNAQLDAWQKLNDDDDDESRGKFRTHCSKWHGFSTDFQRVLHCRLGIRYECVKEFSTYNLRGVGPWHGTHSNSRTRERDNSWACEVTSNLKLATYLQTKRYEQTITALVAPLLLMMTQTFVPLASDHSPNRAWSPPTRNIQKPMRRVPTRSMGLRPHLSMYIMAGT